MKHARTIALFFCLGLILAPLSRANAQSVVIENFIGFDCEVSYLKQPLVHDLIDNDQVFFLTCHIDLKASDNEYEQEMCSRKKAFYAVRDLYTGSQTPYSVVNGRYKTLGFHEGIHKSAVALARKENALIQIPASLEDDRITIALPAITPEENTPFDLWFYAYDFESAEAALDEDSTSAGETLTTKFVNMVTKMDMMGRWDGTPQTISIPLNGYEADGFAVVVQEHRGGAMQAIARIEPGMVSQHPRPQISLP